MADLEEKPTEKKSPAQKSSAPFYRMEFTQITDSGRAWIQIAQIDDEAYEVKTEQGPHNDAISNEFRVNTASVVSLRNKMAEIGVFGWEEEYKDAPLVPNLSWALTIVFQKDVFTQTSRGGSDVPLGFDKFIHLLEQAGMPKPSKGTRPEANPAAGPAGFVFPFDISALGGNMPFNPMGGNPGGSNPTENANNPSTTDNQDNSGETSNNSGVPFDFGAAMNSPIFNEEIIHQIEAALQQMRDHPEMFQSEMRREFNMLTPDQQEQMLGFLSQTGIGDRQWWENFLCG